MKQLNITPQIYKYKEFQDFAEEFSVGEGDLVFTHEFLYTPFMKELDLKCDYLFQEKFGGGEPSDEMIDNIFTEVGDKNYKRIIAVGGGTAIDIAKLLVLKKTERSLDFFEKNVPLIKEREMIIIPTTCGTGSEVTNISIAEIKSKKTKMGLAVEEISPDYAVLIPELVNSLPYEFFVASSIDALIHAIEAYVSPKATPYTELFSREAIGMILKGYLEIIERGPLHRLEKMEDFLIASNYAGIAFGNAGVGAVHALSYPLGGTYHVPHGEANYQFFTEVFKAYNKGNPNGKIKELNEFLRGVLSLGEGEDVYDSIEDILSRLLAKKKLREYGMKEEEVRGFSESVIETQQRLLGNNYIPLSVDDIEKIYQSLY